MLIDDFIEASAQVASVECLNQLYLRALNNFGLDRAICAYLNQYNDQQDILKNLVIQFPEEWMAYYIANDCVNHDPACRWALQHQSIFTLDYISRLGVNKKEAQLLQDAKDANLHNGGAMSVHLTNGCVVGVGFARSQKDAELRPIELQKIYAIVQQYVMILEHLQSRVLDFGVTLKLSDKEKQVLRWCAQGKSNSCIADILRISEHTVNFHLRSIYQKLNANNKTVAVLKAYKLRLMEDFPVHVALHSDYIAEDK